MIIDIITVGDEIVSGDIVDLNSKFLAKSMRSFGHDIQVIKSVGDCKNTISSEVKRSLDSSDILFVTGGLGPTVDDITVEAVADALGRELVFDSEILEKIKARFASFSREMTDNNRKQAYKVESSTVIFNDYGTACGSKIEVDGKLIYILPGPPFELTQMFESIKEDFCSKTIIKSVMFRCLGIGESALETEIIDCIDLTEVEYGIYASKQFVDVKITASGDNEIVVDAILEKHNRAITSKISKFMYSSNQDIIEVVIDILKKRGQRIAISESCTGGMLTSMFVGYSGVSSVLNEGIVTYSNESKINRLGVEQLLLKKHGAVSSEVASQMAENVCKCLGSNIGVSITGVAGPGFAFKPAGTVYIGIHYNENTIVRKYEFEGNREAVRTRSCLTALELIYKVLTKED